MLTVLILFVWASYSVTSIFPEKVIGRLHKGMSMAEVRSVLGEPDSIVKEKENRTGWWYTHPIKWCDFSVEFDVDDRVVHWFEDD